ncbi:hypothetical protein [Pseudomonas putida]|uniref:Transmembrane protein n=1 Tax=Pseudomonas putida TaxID=303 RepID=A0A177SNG5_PSEPU|nr:hypothetical protein [Pseudomonas putida]OAI92288.1 hypothetical protein AYO28_18610 [Pseudomonas putida]
MFGISALGWVHTLGSLPAIPLAAYMFARHGRIVPRSRAGLAYLGFMLVGAGSVFMIAKQPVSNAIALFTLIVLLAGYGVGRVRVLGRAGVYLETVLLSVSAFFLMLPTVSEVLRRVPDGHPIVTDLHAPLLVGTQLGLLLALVLGVTAQVVYLRRQGAGLRARAN